MMDWIVTLGKLFWLPLLFWIGLFFGVRYFAYPLAIKEQIRKGKTWFYVPMWWQKNDRNRFLVGSFLILLVVFAVLASAATVFWLFPMSIYWYLLLVIVFAVAAKLGVRWAIAYVPRLETDCYFYEYRRLVQWCQKNGKPLVEADLRNRCTWSLQNDLRRADARHRFFKYIRAMSCSRKFIENSDAEVLGDQ
jgi:hypothetical protein